MPNLLMPWNEFFDEIEKQTDQEEWLHTALFNDRCSGKPTTQKKPIGSLRA